MAAVYHSYDHDGDRLLVRSLCHEPGTAESGGGGLMQRPTITEEPIQPDPLPDICRECGETCTKTERRLCLSEIDGRFC